MLIFFLHFGYSYFSFCISQCQACNWISVNRTMGIYNWIKKTGINIYIKPKMIILSLKFNKFSRGRSFWKFNNSLLRDRTYVTEIKNVINRVKEQYASPVENM